jgi:hypothetical protein
VPLDTDCEPDARYLDRLNAAVGRKPNRLEPGTEPVDSLVVMASALSLAAENGCDDAARIEDDPVSVHLAQFRSVGVVAHDLGKVLVEGAPEADVQHLQAPADGQEGQSSF